MPEARDDFFGYYKIMFCIAHVSARGILQKALAVCNLVFSYRGAIFLELAQEAADMNEVSGQPVDDFSLLTLQFPDLPKRILINVFF